MSTHVMVDLETMGTGSYAAIISIGAVKFDPAVKANPELWPKFHTAVNLASSLKVGLRVDAATVNWWMSEERAEALKALRAHEPVDLDEALLGFMDWFGDPSLPTWGDGATFDNVILRNAFTLLGLDCPWSYKHDRCFRTIKNLKPVTKPVKFGVGHSALDDAISQALTLCKIAKARRLELE